jgi:DNA-binding transcriptional MerR regulator
MKKKGQTEPKNFHPASEVATLLNIKPYILKYWEKKIPEIKPVKIANRKYYTFEQIETLKRIKRLIDQGFTLSAVKREIKKQTKPQTKEKPTQETKGTKAPNLPGPLTLFPELVKHSNSEKTASKNSNTQDLRLLLREVLGELKYIYESL